MPVYCLTILSAAALAYYVRWRDAREPEPWPAVFVASGVGFVAMWLTGLVDDVVLEWTALGTADVVRKAGIVALIEEGAKLLTMLVLSVVLARQMNDPLDGLVYGRLMGLGMAVNESLLYLGLAPPTAQALGMEIVRLFGHSLMGAIIGFAVGLGAAPRGPRRRFPLLTLGCMALSTALHFGWNVLAYAPPAHSILDRLLPMALMLALMLTWWAFWFVADQRSRRLEGASA